MSGANIRTYGATLAGPQVKPTRNGSSCHARSGLSSTTSDKYVTYFSKYRWTNKLFINIDTGNDIALFIGDIGAAVDLLVATTKTMLGVLCDNMT
jgi:hypothetical protein